MANLTGAGSAAAEILGLPVDSSLDQVLDAINAIRQLPARQMVSGAIIAALGLSPDARKADILATLQDLVAVHEERIAGFAAGASDGTDDGTELLAQLEEIATHATVQQLAAIALGVRVQALRAADPQLSFADAQQEATSAFPDIYAATQPRRRAAAERPDVAFFRAKVAEKIAAGSDVDAAQREVAAEHPELYAVIRSGGVA